MRLWRLIKYYMDKHLTGDLQMTGAAYESSLFIKFIDVLLAVATKTYVDDSLNAGSESF